MSRLAPDASNSPSTGGLVESPPVITSTTLTALSSATNLIFGLLRMKLAAVILAPAGIGYIGVLQSSMGLISTVGDLGVRQSGTRSLALVTGEGSDVTYSRIATGIVFGTALVGLVFSALVIIFAGPVAEHLLEMPGRSDDVRWVALGVGANIAAGGPFVVLNGRANVLGLTVSTILAAILSTGIAVAFLLFRPENSHLAIVVAMPVVTYVFMMGWCLRYLDIRHLLSRDGLIIFLNTTSTAIRDGKFLMVGFIAVSAAEAAVRIMITNALGLGSTGLFTSMWTISIYYIHFLFMLTSYQFYPTLTGMVGRKENASEHISGQLVLITTLASPIIIFAVALAAWWIPIIYSREFLSAKPLFGFIALGDVFRLLCYPLGFVLLAHGRFVLFSGMKLLEAALFVGGTWLLLGPAGALAPGVAHVATQGVLAFAYLWITMRFCSTDLDRGVYSRVAALAAAVAATLLLSIQWPLPAAIFGVLAGAVSAYFAILHMWRMRSSKHSPQHKVTTYE